MFDCGKIVCTVNSFPFDEMKQYDDANGNDYGSAKRYRVVLDSFVNCIKDDLIETTKHLLKGDYGFMCQYDSEPDFETVWSSIFDLESLGIYRAEGDPRRKKFITDSRFHPKAQCSNHRFSKISTNTNAARRITPTGGIGMIIFF